MSLPQDLLEQARLLATTDPRRPKDASLRRAISTAYRDPLRNLVARGFVHSEMGRTARAFSSGYGGLASHIRSIIPEASEYPEELSTVAAAFYDLQVARHKADYDMSYHLTREETFTLLRQAESAFADWKKTRTHKAARTFLVALLMNEKWKRR